MGIKIIISIMLLAGLQFLINSFSTADSKAGSSIDKAWWDGLSEEWQTIFLVNQNFNKQRLDIYSLQNDYINRQNGEGEEDYSEMNKSLHDFNEVKKFSLGYNDLYARALRENHVKKNQSIDLVTLADLDMLYMVNGPGDLTPLIKLAHLKVLIINNCGIGYNVPLNKQVLNLEPLKYLKELQILQCSSNALQSLEAIKYLINLEDLNCDNSSVTTLAPLKNLVNLKRLSFGSKVNSAAIISKLVNLEELYMDGCEQIPDLSNLKKLKKLSIGENSLAILYADYRINSIGFLKNLSELEFLDLDNTSYKGSLDMMIPLQNLKAITLPPVNRSAMQEFKKNHKGCIIINAFKYEG